MPRTFILAATSAASALVATALTLAIVLSASAIASPAKRVWLYYSAQYEQFGQYAQAIVFDTMSDCKAGLANLMDAKPTPIAGRLTVQPGCSANRPSFWKD